MKLVLTRGRGTAIFNGSIFIWKLLSFSFLGGLLFVVFSCLVGGDDESSSCLRQCMGGFPKAFNVRLMLWRQCDDKWVPTVISTSCSPSPLPQLPLCTVSAALASIPSNSSEQLQPEFKAALFNICLPKYFNFQCCRLRCHLFTQTMTKMKQGGERLLAEAQATSACHLLCGRSQLITFAIAVHIQQIGLQGWPFCSLTF